MASNAQNRVNCPKTLEKRLLLIESLRNEGRLTDAWYDSLDALARCEAGLLTFREYLQECVGSMENGSFVRPHKCGKVKAYKVDNVDELPPMKSGLNSGRGYVPKFLK